MVRRRARSDDGTFVVLFGIAIVAILAMVALVIDIGSLASQARANQSVADLAALAAGKNLALGKYTEACQDAVNFLNINAAGMPAISAPSFCGQAGNDVATTTCSGGALTEAQPTTTSGKYTVSIHFPVPASEIQGSGFGTGVNDGTPCQRLRVIITTTDPTSFARVIGINDLTATRSATVRPGKTKSQLIPALWLLDPTGCTALSVSGGSQVTVGVTSPSAIAGHVSVDSDGTGCSSNQVTISSSGSSSLIQAIPSSGADVGSIDLTALPSGAATCTPPACDQADITAGRMTPQPSSSTRATRAPIDWRYNCKPGAGAYPNYHGIAIGPCLNDPTTPPYIDDLRSAVGSSGLPSGTYQRWSTTQSCNPSGTVTVAGNWLVDCAGGLSIGSGTTVTFTNGNVVLDGGISMTGGALNVNTLNGLTNLGISCLAPLVVTPCLDSASDGAAFMYLRSGDWNVTGGAINLKHVMVYQESGVVKLTGNSSPPSWTAPVEGPFTALALWSEKSSNKFQINGGSGVNLQGTFFAPEAAPFSLAGGGNWGQQHAQFIAFHLAVSGGSVLTMAPDATATPRAATGGVLIR